MSTKTLGENRVRVDFNVTNNDNVTAIKIQTANLINQCESLCDSTMSGEKARLIKLAQTAYEEAAMWAVKAATF